MSSPLLLAKSQPASIEKFSADVKAIVERLADVLVDAFSDSRTGKLGTQLQQYATKLFEEWLLATQNPTVDETTRFTSGIFTRSRDIDRIKRLLRKKLPFEKPTINAFTDSVAAELAKGEELESVLPTAIWELYREKLSLFATQCAYVIVGRIVLFLVGSDKHFFSYVLPESGKYLTGYWELVFVLRKFLATIYSLSEFDWWYVPPTYVLTPDQERLLDSIQRRMELSIESAWEALRQYDYSRVDTDVWKQVYLRVLAEEYTRRLGFVPTPDPIVELILDLVGYSSEQQELCNKRLLDPACGSGTFLVEAVVRMRNHLEKKMSCHDSLGLAPWEQALLRLQKITSAVTGVDIHPFATFLTSLNLSFLLLDLYKMVKDTDPSYSLTLRIATHDSLADPVPQEFTTTGNARFVEAARRRREYAEVSAQQFDFVVGNPPWGGVLMGKIGPLGDPNLRRHYKRKFKSIATGKYDIYVLFIAQGMRWLRERGTLGMITQIMYLDQAYGSGLRSYIKQNATMGYLVDVSKFGDVIFPSFTNYPAITVIRRVRPRRTTRVVEVKVSE